MPNDTFYNENSQALKMTNIVTRDSLGSLAVQILATKIDLATARYDDLVIELYNIIDERLKSYERLNL